MVGSALKISRHTNLVLRSNTSRAILGRTLVNITRNRDDSFGGSGSEVYVGGLGVAFHVSPRASLVSATVTSAQLGCPLKEAACFSKIT